MTTQYHIKFNDLTTDSELDPAIEKWLNDHSVIKKFIDEKLADLYVLKNKNHNEILIFKKEQGEPIFDYDTKNGFVNVIYKGFWLTLTSEYLVWYDELCLILQYLIEKAFEIKITSVRWTYSIDI